MFQGPWEEEKAAEEAVATKQGSLIESKKAVHFHAHESNAVNNVPALGQNMSCSNKFHFLILSAQPTRTLKQMY